jgi:hypothetical protein
MNGWKVLTHDFRPPVQGGDPVWDGRRKTLNKVELDTGPSSCAAGWNFCRTSNDALRLMGLWPDGYPSLLLRVRGGKDTIERGCKLRSSRLTILEVCSEDEVREEVRRMSRPFGEHAEVMTEAQMQWRRAFARPHWDAATVEAGLRAALDARGLGEWKLRRYATKRDAWAGRDVRAVWAAWSLWDARVARDSWAAWAARNPNAAWFVRDTWDAWNVRDVQTAGDAWAALTTQFAALSGWTDHDPMLLTTGLRDAYGHGLAVAVPVGPRTLGWAMVENGS